MIISKLDAVLKQKVDAHTELSRLLSTTRGCKKARIEAICRYRGASSTGICPGCGGPLFITPKDNGWCRSCDSKLGRMMLYKSKIRLHEFVGIRATERFIEDYSSMQSIPYALRGDADPLEILDVAHKYLDALNKEAMLRADM